MKKLFNGRKLFILLAALILIGIIVAVRSCTERLEPDLTITYIGEGYIISDEFYAGIPEVEALIDDINGDGQKEIELVTVTFNDSLTASQEQANMSKLTMSMGQGSSRLYLMDKNYCTYYADSEVLADLTDLVPDGAETLVNDNGKVYGICVGDSALLKRLGMDETAEVYASIRAITEMDYVNFKNPGPDEMNKAAEDVLLYIFENKEM